MPSDRSLENLKKAPFKPLGETAMSGKPLCVKVPQDIDDWVRALPNSSAWLREVIVAAAKEEIAKEVVE
jgi:hypothetical protein